MTARIFAAVVAGLLIAGWCPLPPLDDRDASQAFNGTDESTQQFLQNHVSELHAFIVSVPTALPRNS